jgi:CMP-N-acetylneuraminic acid synthetase
MTKVLGMIPAKGGSTRLPRKNILPLGGKPLLVWAGEALRCSGICDRIVVSTDDEEIAQVSIDAGFDVPFIRPSNLACDPAGVEQVALHCLDCLKQKGQHYDILVITLPTSPFVSSHDFRSAFDLFIQKKMDFLMSVSEYDHSPFAALKLENGVLIPWFSEYYGRKSQEMPIAYRCNGAIHILSISAFERTKSYTSQPLYAYKMLWPKGVDIDTPSDYQIAKIILKSGIV